MTGITIDLKTEDNQRISAYEAIPSKQSKGAVLVLQEIFGVNAHIRSVCDRLAAEGFHALAPALFDRIKPGFESGYSPEEIDSAKILLQTFDWDKAQLDMAAATTHLRTSNEKVAAMGFCLGGSLAYLAATSKLVDAAICYYGRHIVQFADQVPKAPTLLHYGRLDHSIPMEDVDTVRKLRPELPLHVYEAGHGFNCDVRESYEPTSAQLAWRRSMSFLDAVF